MDSWINEVKKWLPITVLILVLTLLGYQGSRHISLQGFNRSAASDNSLAKVARGLGAAKIIYSGLESSLSITEPQAGIYVLKATKFACPPGTTNCEPERYEIDYGQIIPHVFGLGMQASANQVELNDFTDTGFGTGHVLTDTRFDFFDSDIGRLRTPIFILPEQATIIAYLQPAVKMLRLSRAGQAGCPAGDTCLVLKKHNVYPEGGPAELLLVKGDNPVDAYSKFNTYLKSRGFFFKEPQYKTFGVNWETFFEFGCQPTAGGIRNAVNRYNKKGVKLSTVTIGSGYWGSADGSAENFIGCGTVTSGERMPATDTLVVSDGRFGGKAGFDSLFSDLQSQGISPIIGMRHQIQLGTSTFDNIARIAGEFKQKGISDPYLDSNNYIGTGDYLPKVRFLKTGDANTMSVWIDILRESYGNFQGLKEDDMSFTDQKHFDSNTPNLNDNLISQTYDDYYRKLGNNFLIFGRNDWFGVGTDAQTLQGWLKYPSSFQGYRFKDFLDSALTQVVSGYPHPYSAISGGGAVSGGTSEFGDLGSDISSEKQKMFYRAHQLSAFWPVTIISRAFWHITNPDYQNAIVFSMQLRNRLNQYAYDSAMEWYRTGVPTAMQPLFVSYPNDSEVYKLYGTSSSSEPSDEFMFGDALLIRPILSEGDSFKVYLPSGNWRAFLQAAGLLTGGRYVDFQLKNINDYPAFLKEGEILPIADAKDPNRLNAYVFLESMDCSNVYTLYKNNQQNHLQACKTNSGVVLKNLDNGRSMATSGDAFGKGFKTGNLDGLLR